MALLDEKQMMSLVTDLDRHQKNFETAEHVLKTLRFFWRMREDSRKTLPDEVIAHIEWEQKDVLRMLRDNLNDLINSSSCLESFIDKDGNFVSEYEENEHGDWEWSGTSTVRTRLASLMHKLGHTPEEAADALVEVCHDELHKTMGCIQQFSPYKDDFEKEELTRRLRVHVYGQEHEDELARKRAETKARIEANRKRG